MADYERPIMHGVTATGDKRPVLVGDDGGLGLSVEGGVSVDFGTKINDSTLGAGGAGNLGWLSSIWKLINDRIPALVSGKIPVSIDAILSVAGSLVSVSNSFTRPSDTTAYTALDVVSPASTANLTFSNVARVNGGSGYIVKVRLLTNQSANTARFRLHLFHTAPTAIADNAPYTLLFDNAANRIGSIDLPACKTEGSGSDTAYTANITDRLPFVCNISSRNIVGILEAIDAFTPTSGQQFYVELTADLN